jgi:hypothetical protein
MRYVQNRPDEQRSSSVSTNILLSYLLSFDVCMCVFCGVLSKLPQAGFLSPKFLLTNKAIGCNSLACFLRFCVFQPRLPFSPDSPVCVRQSVQRETLLRAEIAYFNKLNSVVAVVSFSL